VPITVSGKSMGTQGLHSRTNLHVAAVWNAKLYEIIAF
jgi:hypothetical protein